MAETAKQPTTQAPAVQTAPAPQPSELDRLVNQPRRELDLFDNAQFGQALQLAQQLSTATGFVPRHLLGNPGACLGIVSLADAWRVNPFLLAASSSDVHGKLLFEAKAVQAGIERSGAIVGRLTFTLVGDWSKIQGRFALRQGKDGQSSYPAPAWQSADEEGLAIDVTGTPAGSADPVTERCWLKACHPRNSTLWATDPATQCRYRATRNWARLVVPGIMLGAVSSDEYEAMPETTQEPKAATIAPAYTAAVDAVKARKTAAVPAPATATPPKPKESPAPFHPLQALAAMKAVDLPEDLATAYLRATGALGKTDTIQQARQQILANIVERPADLKAAASEWLDQQAK